MSELDQNMETPSIRLRQPGLLVYLCGIATSILTIVAVHWVNRNGTYIMGWFVNGILPGGAILVGVTSGLGYAVGSRVLNVKLSKLFLAVMFATGIIDYFAVQYLTYTSVISVAGVPAEAYSFVDYMRDHAEKMTFQGRHDRVPGQALGIWGYGFQLLILLGFAVGAMVPSLVVSSMQYCHRCQAYLKNHRVGYLRSPERWTDLKALKKAERKTALESITATISNQAQQFAHLVSQMPFAETEASVRGLDSSIPKDAAAVVSFTLMKCPHCDAHYLSMHLSTYAANKQVATAVLGAIDKTQSVRPSRANTDQAADDDVNEPPRPRDDGLYRES